MEGVPMRQMRGTSDRLTMAEDHCERKRGRLILYIGYANTRRKCRARPVGKYNDRHLKCFGSRRWCAISFLTRSERLLSSRKLEIHPTPAFNVRECQWLAFS